MFFFFFGGGVGQIEDVMSMWEGNIVLVFPQIFWIGMFKHIIQMNLLGYVGTSSLQENASRLHRVESTLNSNLVTCKETREHGG